jgi:rod shape determining protein RodA
MFKESLKNVSFVFIAIPVILSFIGLIFIYSTGINPDGTNNFQYIRQLIWMVIGVGLAILIINIDYYQLVETSNIYYIIGLILLIITLIFGRSIRGSKSWMGIASLGIQPSEIMKLFYILFFAKYLSNAPVMEKKLQTFLVSLLILGAPLVLILVQPDLGTSIVFFVIFILMSFLGMADDTYIRYFIYTGLATIFIVMMTAFYKFHLGNGGEPVEFLEIILSFNTLMIISITMLVYSVIAIVIDFFNPVEILKKLLPFTLIVCLSFMTAGVVIKMLKDYQWKRIQVMINPEFDRSKAGYNIIQSKIAIGSGGFFGKGLFRGTQNTLGFVPEKSTDFIYSIISEELGFFGSCLVMLLFVVYFYYIIRTIQSAKDKEGMLVAAGILAMFFTHYFVNIGMTLGLTPATGLPLPFISYGGSSCIAFLCAAALLSNIYSRRFVH